MSAAEQLARLRGALVETRDGAMNAQAFSALARAQGELLATLPAKYADVLHQLLDRLESSALFTEESCSFSQKDLLDSLQMWADKSQAQLGR
ncbi:MAG: hypothetical protein EOO28_20955 [Comamonadaceae bacterium]|nr:MAG: hypothetical protein EOO28_20955 [Comamonadaceae bacterium]